MHHQCISRPPDHARDERSYAKRTWYALDTSDRHPPRDRCWRRGRFDNSYARLPQRLYARLTPTPVRSPRLVQLNAALAEAVGLETTWLESAEGTAVLAGNHARVG